MTAFDYIVLLILGVSILLSVMRGAVKEVLALLGWIVAFWIANVYAGRASYFIPEAVPSETLRLLVAFIILFLGALLVMSLITITLSELVKSVGLGMMDRGLGAVFGLLRGLLIVTILVLLAGLTSFPKERVWQNAMFSAPLEALATKVKQWLPDDIAGRIRYES